MMIDHSSSSLSISLLACGGSVVAAEYLPPNGSTFSDGLNMVQQVCLDYVKPAV